MGWYQIGVGAGLMLGAFAMFYVAWFWAARRRRRDQAGAPQAAPAVPSSDAGPVPPPRRVEGDPDARRLEGDAMSRRIEGDAMTSRLERRMDEIEAAQAALAERVEEAAAEDGSARMQSVAGSLVSLIKDKNATLETALAGLDQLRARLKTLEQMGDLAEARGLFDRLGARLDAIETGQAAALAGVEARLAAQAPGETPLAEISEQFTRLYAQKDATVETVFARLTPLEARLAETEGALGRLDPQAALDRFAERLEEQRQAFQARITALEASEKNPFAEDSSEQLTRLYAQKDATVETVFARLAPLEARVAELQAALGGHDRDGADLARLAAEVAALRRAQDEARGQLAALQVRAEANPSAEITEQLTRLYGQKDATAETVFSRLTPLEAKLGEIEGRLGALDPQAALERFAERLEEQRQAFQTRIAALEAPGENPFAEISDQLTRLYAQKDATVETVFACLAPLEAKLAAVEGVLRAQDPQAALARFAERLEELRGTFQTRITALETAEGQPFAEISEQLTRLYAQKDATAGTVFARLGPLEAKLAALEGALGAQNPQGALDRFAERLEEQREAFQARITALETPGENPFAEISEQLTRLYAQKDATVETVFARLAPLEAKLAEMEAALGAQNPQAALDRFAERLEEQRQAFQSRITALESEENPFTEISEQLTRLYAQKDATVETVFARLAPLEAKLGELEAALAAQDPGAVLERFAERLEAARSAQEAVCDRLVALETAENPYTEISDQLTRLYAQKDATAETVFARLAPLEAKLAEMEAALGTQNPQRALDRFAERLEDLRQGFQSRITALESEENPFTEISEQLTRLYTQKDATVETVFARLAPLEAKLAAVEAVLGAQDPKAALDRFAERLEEVQTAGRTADGMLQEQIRALAGAENPFAEISEQLTRLYAQKDATAETVFTRLAPLEAKLGTIEARLGAQDPQAALERFAERLEEQREAFQSRITALESEENPFTEISDQLTRLYAQKDATVETVFARLAPLEARLAEIEGVSPRLAALEAGIAARDPRAAMADLAARLDALQGAQGDVAGRLAALQEAAGDARPYAEIAEQLTRLYAQKDATVEAVFARLAPLEARLAELETRDIGAEEAQAEAQAIATQMIAMRAVAEQTELFANRLALLETSLPRLSRAQMLMMQALEQQSVPWSMSEPDRPALPAAQAQAPERAPDHAADPAPEVRESAAAAAAPAPAPPAADLDEIWQMPRIVSLHQTK